MPLKNANEVWAACGRATSNNQQLPAAAAASADTRSSESIFFIIDNLLLENMLRFDKEGGRMSHFKHDILTREVSYQSGLRP